MSEETKEMMEKTIPEEKTEEVLQEENDEKIETSQQNTKTSQRVKLDVVDEMKILAMKQFIEDEVRREQALRMEEAEKSRKRKQKQEIKPVVEESEEEISSSEESEEEVEEEPKTPPPKKKKFTPKKINVQEYKQSKHKAKKVVEGEKLVFV